LFVVTGKQKIHVATNIAPGLPSWMGRRKEIARRRLNVVFV